MGLMRSVFVKLQSPVSVLFDDNQVLCLDKPIRISCLNSYMVHSWLVYDWICIIEPLAELMWIVWIKPNWFDLVLNWSEPSCLWSELVMYWYSLSLSEFLGPELNLSCTKLILAELNWNVMSWDEFLLKPEWWTLNSNNFVLFSYPRRLEWSARSCLVFFWIWKWRRSRVWLAWARV